jgi:sigma-E factor negative regulatory protein RseB
LNAIMRGGLLGGLLALASSPAFAAPAAEELVQKMMGAARALDYEGVFVYQRDSSLDTMRVIHRGSGSLEMERLVSLTGPAREVIRDGNKVICKWADKHAMLVEQRQPRDILSFGIGGSVKNLEAVYQFSIEGDDRIAGRQADVVKVSPHTPDRYAYRLWIDRETGLLLKSVITDEHDRALEQEQFAEVAIGQAIPDSLFESELPGTDFVRYANDDDPASVGAASDNEAPWGVNWLPPGFALHHDKSQRMASSNVPVRHFVYSDGLATVSVFIEKIRAEVAPLKGFSLVGAVNAFSSVAHDHQVTVVGEVPQNTVRRIASSVAPRNSE